MKNFFTVVVLVLFGNLFVVSNTYAVSPSLGVTQISAVQTIAQADNTFENGWKWVFNITVPMDETIFSLKFADWVGSDTIPAANNIRFYSTQSSNAYDPDHAITITSAGEYSAEMYINPDTGNDIGANPGDGRQIQVVVQVRIPAGSAGGSYSSSYGVKSLPDNNDPVITLVGANPQIIEFGGSYVELGATALDDIDGNITPNIVITGTGSIDTSIPGTYTVTYNVSDSASNHATPVTRIVQVAPNTSVLSVTISSAQALHGGASEGENHGQYAVGSKAILQTAIDLATNVKNSTTTTQIEVDNAVIALNSAVDVFKAGKVPTPDTTALSAAILEAQIIHNNAVEGTDPGEYLIGSKIMFQITAIFAATNVKSDTTATQAEIDAALAKLNDDIGAFESNKVPFLIEL